MKINGIEMKPKENIFKNKVTLNKNEFIEMEKYIQSLEEKNRELKMNVKKANEKVNALSDLKEFKRLPEIDLDEAYVDLSEIQQNIEEAEKYIDYTDSDFSYEMELLEDQYLKEELMNLKDDATYYHVDDGGSSFNNEFANATLSKKGEEIKRDLQKNIEGKKELVHSLPDLKSQAKELKAVINKAELKLENKSNSVQKTLKTPKLKESMELSL